MSLSVEDIISDSSVRAQLISHLEVLEKTKQLILIPGTDFLTVEGVAEYFNVSSKAIENLYNRHTKEIVEDGAKLCTKKEFLNLHVEGLEETTRVSRFVDGYGNTISVSNRGKWIFPKRAILRIAMLLRDSEVAKEIRTQLLNIFEHAEQQAYAEQDSNILVGDIEQEQNLMLDITKSILSGDVNATMMSLTAYVNFTNRHAKELEEENKQIKADNERVKADNKLLVGDISTWDNRAKINAGIRGLSKCTHIPYGNMWGELYRELKYRYHIDLKARNGKPLDTVQDDEWEYVFMVFAAMCDKYGYSPSELINHKEKTLSQ